jgi:hypothetical protein
MSHENQIVNTSVEQSSAASVVPLPAPRVPITIRPATLEDLPFIDGLQKKNTKQVRFMPTKQFEGKIRAGHVLVAEEGTRTEDLGLRGNASAVTQSSALSPQYSTKVGYLIGNDQYFKHDDIGIIYQINVIESHRRGFVGAALLRAQFERSAYGCRLYCCWCAQDIEANRFWESMGFVPLAFRTGSAAKSRIHIFWQKRIREGDESTPWWFPSQTSSGSIREDRLVFPIPPGRHWSDEMPRILPAGPVSRPSLEAPKQARRGKSPEKKEQATMGRLQFNIPAPPKCEKTKREPRPKQKNDPKLIAAARELRDRWLETVNEPGGASQLLANGKYSVARRIAAGKGAGATGAGGTGARAKAIARVRRVAALGSPIAA